MIKFLPSGLCILLNLPMVFGGSPEAAKPSDQPNILVIMSDDQGVGELSFNDPLLRMPVLNQLGSNPQKERNYRPLPMKLGDRIRVKVVLDGNAAVACLFTRMYDRPEKPSASGRIPWDRSFPM